MGGYPIKVLRELSLVIGSLSRLHSSPRVLTWTIMSAKISHTVFYLQLRIQNLSLKLNIIPHLRVAYTISK